MVTSRGVCKDCGRPFVWARRPDGSWLPLDVHPRGNVVLDAKGFTGPTEEGDRPDVTVRYLRHAVACDMRLRMREGA